MKSLLLNIMDSVAYPVCKEPSLLSHEKIRQLVGKEDPVILEIGANDGTDTEQIFELFENPRIYCFEPEPRAIKKFRKKFDGNPNVSLFECALSDENGETDFFRCESNREYIEKGLWPAGWDKSGSLREPKLHLKIHPYIGFESKITVKTKTLDSWCEENQVKEIDFIWMDVQGAEHNVFLGAEKSLKNIRYIYTEYSNKELYQGQVGLRAMLKILKTFQVKTRFPNDVLLENTAL